MFKITRSSINLIRNLNKLNQISLKHNIAQSSKLIKNYSFPNDIQLPIYAENELNDDSLFERNILTYQNLSRDLIVIDGVKEACKIAKQILHNAKLFIKPNMTGNQIDEFIYEQCLKLKCYPSPLNYNGFPKCVTLCLNDVVIHGIPDDKRKLIVGDILKVDVSIYYKGFHGDTAETFLISNDKATDVYNLMNSKDAIDENGLKLIRTAKQCLDRAIEACRSEVHLNEIGHVIDKIAKENGFNVIPAVCGHSIGEYLHGLPQIVHCPYDEYTEDDILLENMIITLEPYLCEFEPDVVLEEDGWTITTEDNGRSAGFEHTILIKKDHAEILT